MNRTLRNTLIGAIAGVWTACDGHTGGDIRRGHRYSDKECDALLQTDLRKVASAINPLMKVCLPQSKHHAAAPLFPYCRTGPPRRS